MTCIRHTCTLTVADGESGRIALDARNMLLVEGDSHVFKADNPLAAGDANYGVTMRLSEGELL